MDEKESKLDPLVEIVTLEETVRRNYDSLSVRVARLERASSGKGDDDFLSGKLLGFMLIMSIAPIAMELIAGMVKSWRSSSSD
jgi:hypothetical protein